MFFKIGVIRNFALFTGKHVLESLFNKVAGLAACNFISISFQKRLQHWYFSCEYCKIFKNNFYYRTPLVAAFVSLIKQQLFIYLFINHYFSSNTTFSTYTNSGDITGVQNDFSEIKGVLKSFGSIDSISFSLT